MSKANKQKLLLKQISIVIKYEKEYIDGEAGDVRR